jgi:hypothetical protein
MTTWRTLISPVFINFLSITFLIIISILFADALLLQLTSSWAGEKDIHSTHRQSLASRDIPVFSRRNGSQEGESTHNVSSSLVGIVAEIASRILCSSFSTLLKILPHQ